ncbi:hypothetical protein BJ741DRAFT_628464 [Chytriomyces cf. hyalinus JEL632]|nr:hypothetical protein BJ741DRAFT_628464 [Chytriomyces cf. hyalinus JEL632]
MGGSNGNICVDSSVEIRDFAYARDDRRHFGHPQSLCFKRNELRLPARRPSKTENLRKPEIIYDTDGESHIYLNVGNLDETTQDTDNDDDMDDENTNLSLLGTFPFLAVHVQQQLNRPAGVTGKQKLRVTRSKGLFDFTKGADYEMDLKESEHVLLVETDSDTASLESSLDGTGALDKLKAVDRFASIEDLDSPLLAKSPMLVDSNSDSKVDIKTASVVQMEPEPEELVEHLEQFLQMQHEYGTGWVVAVKVCLRDVGGGPVLGDSVNALLREREDGASARVVHRFSVRLVDLGLVPRSYVK